MGRDGEGGKKEMKGSEEKRFAGPMSNCFLRAYDVCSMFLNSLVR